MTRDEAVKEIEEYIADADKAVSEDEEYIRGWKSALLVALEVITNITLTKANLMDQDLAEKIYWILIEEGQRNLKFPLGSIITNTPDEVRDIIRKHIEELT